MLIALLCAGVTAVFGGSDSGAPVQLAKLDRTPSYEIIPLPDGYEVSLIVEGQDRSVPHRTVHIDYQTQNLSSNQLICLFVRSDNGEYYPIPAHQMNPRVLPINRKATASVELYGAPPSERFNICFFVLDERDQRRMRKWLLREHAKGSFYMTSRAIELGCISLN